MYMHPTNSMGRPLIGNVCFVGLQNGYVNKCYTIILSCDRLHTLNETDKNWIHTNTQFVY